MKDSTILLKKDFFVWYKSFFTFIFLTTFFSQGYCDDEDQSCCYYTEECCEEPCKLIPLEFKAGYYLFADSTMRKVYSSGGYDLQISGAYPICDWLEVYGSVEYFNCKGKSLNEHQSTTFYGIPVSLGLKPIFNIAPGVKYYFAIGPRYFYLHQHNDSEYVDKNLSHNAFGGFVNTGFNFCIDPNIFIDIFAEYSYAKTRFHSSKLDVYTENIQVGGYVFGAGIGYAF